MHLNKKSKLYKTLKTNTFITFKTLTILMFMNDEGTFLMYLKYTLS